MAKKKSKARGKASEGKSAPPPPVDAARLEDAIQDELDKYTHWNSALQKQKELVEKLEEQLAYEREKLEFLAKPLRKIHELVQSDQVRKLAAAKPYDAALRACLGKLKLSSEDYDTKSRGYKTKSTGAKAWKTLQREGATDEQIKTNLQNVKTGYLDHSSGGGHHFSPHSYTLTKLRNGSSYNGVKVLQGAAAVVKEVRRVFAIPEPTKGAETKAKPAAQKSAAKKKSSTKPAATRKKPSAKAGPKSAAKKKSSKPAKKKPGSTNGKPLSDLCELHGGSSVVAKQEHQLKGKTPSKRPKNSIVSFPNCRDRGLLRTTSDAKGQTVQVVDEADLVATLTPEGKAWWTAEITKFPEDYPRVAALLLAGPVEGFLEAVRQAENAMTPAKASTNGKHAPTNRIAKHFDEQFTDPTKPAPTSSPPELAGVTAGAMPRPEPAAVTGDAAVDRADAIAACKPMEAALLEEIFAAYPATKTKAQITEAAGYQPGGKVSAAFKSLWRAGYIDEIGRSTVKASAAYFDAEPVGAAE